MVDRGGRTILFDTAAFVEDQEIKECRHCNGDTAPGYLPVQRSSYRVEAARGDNTFSAFIIYPKIMASEFLAVLTTIIILNLCKPDSSVVVSVLANAIIYSFTIVFTIVIAGLSYKYYESYFLTLKKRFARIEKA